MKYTIIPVLLILLQLSVAYSQRRASTCKYAAADQLTWQQYDSLGNALLMVEDTSEAIWYFQHAADLNIKRKPALDALRKQYIHTTSPFYLREN